ncbi:unnamed protein product [Ilex paraguariensis]|uniref:Chlororespiratory reduction 7 n=1 Tax=Ilex paraguariensis TaxID=185542 RepID=A0ABC8UMS2_9AQUA
MARLLAQSLTRKNTTLSLPCLTHHHHHHNHRHRSNKAQLIEIDLDTSNSESTSESTEIDVHSVRKLEEVIQNIVVRRSAPDWLPFIPGSSYWVPPRHLRHPYNVVEVIGKVSAAPQPISEDETLSLTSDRGWPSSAYFIDGTGW